MSTQQTRRQAVARIADCTASQQTIWYAEPVVESNNCVKI